MDTRDPLFAPLSLYLREVAHPRWRWLERAAWGDWSRRVDVWRIAGGPFPRMSTKNRLGIKLYALVATVEVKLWISRQVGLCATYTLWSSKVARWLGVRP